MKIIKRILISLLVIIIASLVLLFIYLQILKPQYSGELEISGIKNSTNVHFDTWGIPHIYAENQHDAYFALGYVHAQERLFQMEMMKRVASGRLSEILGPDLIETDKFFISLGIDKYAEQVTKDYFSENENAYQTALAYIDGFNEYIKNGTTPIEYKLLGIKKEEFSLEQMNMIIGYIAFTFNAAFTIDPIVTKIHQKYGNTYLNDLAINDKGSLRIPVHRNDSAYKTEEQLTAKILRLKKSMPIPEWIGSNSWVLAPQKTASGKVIFANDTHIGYSQPSVWYEAHLEFPEHQIYGNYLAGIPFALLGHNKNTAWGLTMFENDDTDLFREKLNPDNNNQVWFKDHWEDLKVEKRKIKVKDAEDVDFELKISRHGPIMNETLSHLDRNEQPIAVWWTFTQLKSDLLKALFDLNYSTNINDTRQVARTIHAPGLNVMYGDIEGNIAWWAAAKLVKRPEHVNSKIILDGASGNDEYSGFYDFSENPQSENPPSGFVYSANNQPDSTSGILYPGYYAPDFRAKRINQLINTNEKWTIEKMKKMSTNVVSAVHPDIAKLLLSEIEKQNLLVESDNKLKAYELLKKWDGNHLKEDIAPVIYYKLLYHVLHNTIADEIGETDFNSIVSTHLMQKSIPVLLKNNESPWWDNINTNKKETRHDIIVSSFHQTIADLEKQLGKNINEWKWGKVHTIEHVHPIGRQEPFDYVFNVGPFNVMGGNQVINNIDFHLEADGTYEATYGPAIRILLDFNDIENSLSVLPTGESGRFMSKHYDDQAEMYNNGTFRKQMTNKEEILTTKEGTLLLKPMNN